jgi:peptidyl-prolyl cis-trans isomerase D
MIQLIRSIFKSKIGLAITFAFIALIALAFASSDVAGTASFGGIAGGDRVAVIGDEKIGNAEFARSVSAGVDQVRQENPTITMPQFIEGGGLDEVLEQLIDRYALAGYAQEYGLRAGKNLVNSEILQIPAFRGPDGNFSQEAYQFAIRQQGLSDAMVRDGLRDSLLAQIILDPASAGATMPQNIAKRYASLQGERRQGGVSFVPSALFAPEEDPTNAQIEAFYTENRENYVRPERRTIRYAIFGEESVDPARIEPTPAEIQARYERDRSQYAARETRSFTQLILPTREAAEALRAQAQAGTSLETLAGRAGFSTSRIGPIERSAYVTQTNETVANAVFAAQRGTIAEPARGSLGWHVVRIDNVTPIPARSIAQVTPDIRSQLLVEKRAAALSDLSAGVEEQLSEGTPLSEVVEELGLALQSSAPLTSDGRIYGNPQFGAPPQIQSAIETAFQMDEGQPQLAEIGQGGTFLIFEVGEIIRAAAAPLSEIREQVELAWRLSEGSKLANKAAARVIKRIEGGAELSAALGEEELQLPPADQLNLTRTDLRTQFGQQVPAPVALFFTMAEGSTKKLEAPNKVGWFVVNVASISVDEMDENNPAIAITQSQLRAALASEYQEQLIVAMREALGVEVNDAAIDAVRNQLIGVN